MAEAQAGILEQALLAKEGIRPEDFRVGKGLSMPGERRPLRIPISAITTNQQDDRLTLSFALPKGSFATTVLREVMKTPEPVRIR
jgi:tRNA pseudouridine13 synthase